MNGEQRWEEINDWKIYRVPNISHNRWRCYLACLVGTYCRRRRRWKWLNRMRLHVVIYYCSQFCQTWDKHYWEDPFHPNTRTHTRASHTNSNTYCQQRESTRSSHLRFFFSVYFFIVIMLANSMCSFCSLLRVFSDVCSALCFFSSFPLRCVLYLHVWMFNCPFPHTFVGNMVHNMVIEI